MATQRRKAIPEARDRLQSRMLVWVVGTPLAIVALGIVVFTIVDVLHWKRSYIHVSDSAWIAVFVSLTFAVTVWALKAATPAAAFFGGTICVVLCHTAVFHADTPLHSALAPLFALFVLTFLATRAGREGKSHAGLAEERRGRNAAQVIANLGSSATLVLLAPFIGYLQHDPLVLDGPPLVVSRVRVPVMVLAALCEATADTVSSEIGQAFGSQPYLLTNFRRVDPGTDGAISLLGTIAGAIAATIVAAVGMWAMRMSLTQAAIACAGGIAGLLFDSFLGATVERKGWLGNDLVNFSSTVFAVLVALALLAMM